MEYEVLCPWAEVDPIPVKPNSPRVTDLNGKTIGLYAFYKERGPYITREIERQLKAKYPTAKFSHFWYPKHVKEVINDPEYKEKFEEWVKGADTFVSAYGD